MEAETATVPRSGFRLPRPIARFLTWDVALVALLVSGFLVLLYLGRHLSFWWDEWEVIDAGTGWSLDELMEPHNQHWSLGLLIVYKGLLATVGMHSFVPYLAVVLLLHSVLTAGLYVIAKGQAGAMAAFMVALVFMFFGAGWEGYLLGFQIGFVGAAAAGIWALALMLEDHGPRRTWPAALLLLVAIATSGTGIMFLAAAIVAAALSERRRSLLPLVAPAAGAYLVWFLLYGRADTDASVLSPENVAGAAAYAWEGVVRSIASASGSNMEIAAVLAVLLGVFLVLHAIGAGPLHRPLLAGATGLAATWVFLGLTRNMLGEAASSRYQYLAGVFVLIIFASLLGMFHRTPSRLRFASTVLVLAGVGLMADVFALGKGLDQVQSWHDRSRATVSLLLRYGGTPGVPLEKGSDEYYPPTIPGPARLRELVAMYGSPVDDAISGPHPIPTWALDTMLFQIVQARLEESVPAARPVMPALPAIIDQSNVELQPEDGCLRLASAGGAPVLTVEIERGERLYLRSDAPHDVAWTLSRFGAFHPLATRTVPLAAGVPWGLMPPDLGDDGPWLVRLQPGGPSQVLVCVG